MSLFKVSQLSVIREVWGDDVDDFWIEVHCEVQSQTEPGGEAFSLSIVSPKSLLTELNGEDFRAEYGRGFIITNHFDQNKIIGKLQKLVDGSEASSWKELIDYMSKYFDVI